MKRLCLTIGGLLTAASVIAAQDVSRPPNPPSVTQASRMVMTWVAPYAVAKSKARLEETYGGLGMKDGLTHLALQFWERRPRAASVALSVAMTRATPR